MFSQMKIDYFHSENQTFFLEHLPKNSQKFRKCIVEILPKKNELGAVQRVSNVVDLEKSEKMRLLWLS